MNFYPLKVQEIGVSYEIKGLMILLVTPAYSNCLSLTLSSASWHAENVSVWFVPCVAICPQGCRNGGICVAPGICSCPEGWLGGACHTGELKPNSHMQQFTLQA